MISELNVERWALLLPGCGLAAECQFRQSVAMKSLIFVLLTCLPLSVFAEGGLPNQPYIYVEGHAEIQKAADTLTLTFDLVGSGPDLAKANENVQSKANKIFAMLKERKVADNDVIAQNIRTQPDFEEEENYGHRRTKLIGYRVIREFEIRLRDITVYPKLIDEFIALGGTEFTKEVEGSLSKQKEIEEQLRDKALTNARERAEKVAKAMGVKIESVFAISSAPFPEITKTMFDLTERVVVTGMNIPPPMPAPEYRLAPITVIQNVHAIFLISPAK